MNRLPSKHRSRRIVEWLTRKYYFGIYWENYELRRSFSFRPWQVFLAMVFVVLLLVATTVAITAFTSLREYIPGYSDIATQQRVLYLTRKTDSLSKALQKQITYLHALNMALYGHSPFSSPVHSPDLSDSLSTEPIPHVDELIPDSVEIEFQRRFENSLLRSLQSFNNKQHSLLFFPPVEIGYLTAGFDPSIRHYAIDLATPKNAIIRSVAAGRVVFQGYSPQFGNIIIVQHSGGLLSIFKHCASILAKEGTFVKPGMPIATVGSTGELSTGPHLHFELWMDGVPIDPTWFIKLNRNVWQEER